MPYSPQEWKNRNVEKPKTYAMTDHGDGMVTLDRAPGQIFEPGTPFTAERMNHLEKGVEEAYLLAERDLPKNLLINSDFLHVVNSLGKINYTGQNMPCMDGWKTGSAFSKIRIDYTGVTIVHSNANETSETTAGIKQMIPIADDILYKWLTGVVWLDRGKMLIVQLNLASETVASASDGKVQIELSVIGHEIEFSILVHGAGLSCKVIRTAVYLGQYDEVTMPPYVYKHWSERFHECGIPVQPKNLLINSNFCDPINSDGQKVYNYSGAQTRTIDCWNVSKAGSSVEIVDGGIRLNAGSNVNLFFQDVILPEDGAYLCCAKVDDKICFKRFSIVNGITSASSGENDKFDGGQITTNSNPSSRMLRFGINVDKSCSVTVAWAGCYKWPYMYETCLPEYQPKERVIEMYNCGVDMSPRNLLDNSDFQINTQGVTSNPAQLMSLFVNRWEAEAQGATAGMVTVSANGVTLAPTASLYCSIAQKIAMHDDYAGKTCTLAVCAGGVWYSAVFTVGETPSGGITLANGMVIYSMSTYTVVIRNMAGGAPVTIQAVALYEGVYTIDTLPKYQPKDRIVEMYNCGVSLNPVNLLDNSYFLNPINQRGQTTATAGSGYFIDRWHCAGNCEASISTNGLSATGDNGISQILPDKHVGKTFTFAACEPDGTLHVLTAFISEPSGSAKWLGTHYATNGIFIGIMQTSGGYVSVYLDSNRSSFIWAALYEGAYTADTLPAYQPKGYAAELAECQRYYQRLMNPDFMLVTLAEGKAFTIKHPNMRIIPSVTVKNPATGGINSITSQVNGGEFAVEFTFGAKNVTSVMVPTGAENHTYGVAYEASADL